MNVAVVIPYYQERPGILARALASIAAQVGVDAIDVLIVDDGSPAPPGPELAAVTMPAHVHVRVLVQPNAGPARARNAALDAVGKQTPFVAFLDSDDEWLPMHLCNALAALGRGNDLYFANFREPGDQRDAFGSDNRLQRAEHPALSVGSNCHQYCGSLAKQIISANVIETSTVVFRHARFADLRFREDFSSAFEDYLFWLAMADRAPGIVFSWNVECQYGLGVNVWRGTGFGSPRAFRNLLAQCRYVKEIQQRPEVAAIEPAIIARKRRSYRECFVAECVYRFRHGQSLDMHNVVGLFREDPALVYQSALIVGRALLGKLTPLSTRH